MKTIEVFYEVLDTYVAEFQGHPFDSLYESDIQACIYCRLASVLNQRIAIKTSGDFRRRYLDQDLIETTLVKSEYPTKIRFDIAVIDDTQASDQYLPWEQKVRLAIEIKYYQCGDRMRDRVQGFKRDLAKLSKHYNGEKGLVTQLGVALLFLQRPMNLTKFFEQELIQRLVPKDHGVQGIIIMPGDVITLGESR